MRNWLLVGMAVLAVGVGGYLLLAPSGPSQQGTQDPSTPGEPDSSTSAVGDGDETVPPEARRTEPHGSTGRSGERPYTKPGRAPASTVPRQSTGPREYESAHYGLKVRKPDGPGWMMSTDPARFFIQEPGKVVEMHRNAGTGDRPFGTIYVYVLAATGSGDGGREVGELERLDKKAPPSEFRMEEERRVRVGAQQMIRRVTCWKATGRETKFLSVRCGKPGKFYVLLAFADPDDFDALLPDFEAAIRSLEIG